MIDRCLLLEKIAGESRARDDVVGALVQGQVLDVLYPLGQELEAIGIRKQRCVRSSVLAGAADGVCRNSFSLRRDRSPSAPRAAELRRAGKSPSRGRTGCYVAGNIRRGETV